MLSMSWITAILHLYSQVADLFGNVIVKRINIRLFDLLARFHYILNLPRRMNGQNSTKFCIHIIIDKIFVGILKRHFFANLQQSNNP